VLKIYTAAWLPRLREILALLKEKFHANASFWPSRTFKWLRNAGLRPGEMARLYFQNMPGRRPALRLFFPRTACALRRMSCADRKTGFFLDQRENRREVETLARGRRVLNAFSFSGGFSVYAARGGATSVTDLDISAHALNRQSGILRGTWTSRRGGVPA